MLTVYCIKVFIYGGSPMSIEILPNWHPFFVHFTIALIFVGSALYLFTHFFSASSRWRQELLLVATWSLFLAAGFTVLTLIAGVHAYLTVGHDGASHMAMIDHRNWGIGASVLLIISLALLKFSPSQSIGRLLTSFILIFLLGSVLITGYKGSHLVYKYGLGVQSLPKSPGGHHDHHSHRNGKKDSSDHKHDHDGHSH